MAGHDSETLVEKLTINHGAGWAGRAAETEQDQDQKRKP